MSSILLAIALSGSVTGCSGMNRAEDWPTLAPRPGEVSPLVPRTPLGACAGCGQDVFVAPPAVAVPPPLPAPADAGRRLDAAEAVIADLEARVPAQRAAAEAAARDSGTGANAATEAEVQRSRFEALFLPLAGQARVLDQVEDDLAGRTETEALQKRLALLRDRLARLEAERIASLGI